MSNSLQHLSYPISHSELIEKWGDTFQPLVDEFSARVANAIDCLSDSQYHDMFVMYHDDDISIIELGKFLASQSDAVFHETEYLSLGFQWYLDVNQKLIEFGKTKA